jgi:outer membrane protein OmpA-like peptidoglycan-associated protein
MVENILGLLKGQLNDGLLTKMAGFLGEDKSSLNSAVGTAAPSILLGLLQKGTEPGGASALLKMMEEGKHDGGILNNLGSVLGGGSATTDYVASGTRLLGSLFGDKAGGIGNIIASASGISQKSGFSLLGMLTPILMGLLGKLLKAGGGFSASGLTNLLLGQKDFLKSALPSGVTQLLGVGNLDNLGRQAVQTAQAAAAPAKKIWPWIALAILALLLLLWWRSCSTPVAQKATETAKETATAVQDTTAKIAEKAKEAWAALGKFFVKKLPNGVELNIPEFGIENKLLAFIEDAKRPIDEKLWFSFDRLLFDTGKATLQPESQEQLKNMAEILKAYPNVKIKIGGYTDNTGDPQANLKLSQARANTVMADLVKLGVDGGRMKAEGYGQEHPVADNSTEEGRAKNRRIDLRVESK